MTTVTPVELDRRRVLRRGIGILIGAVAGVIGAAWLVVRDPRVCDLYGSLAGIPHLSLVPFGPTCTASFVPTDTPTSPEPLWSVLLIGLLLAVAVTAVQLARNRPMDSDHRPAANSTAATSIPAVATTRRYHRRHFTIWTIAGAVTGTALWTIPFALLWIPRRLEYDYPLWHGQDSAEAAILGLAPGAFIGLAVASITLLLRRRTVHSHRWEHASIAAAVALYCTTLMVITIAQYQDGTGRVDVRYYAIPLVSAAVFAAVGARVWRPLAPDDSVFSGRSPFGLAGDAAGQVGDHELQEGP